MVSELEMMVRAVWGGSDSKAIVNLVDWQIM